MFKKEDIVKLDSIILSDNVVDEFYHNYNNNSQFQTLIDTNISDIKRCQEQKQNNPWHKYNVLGHILHSIEEMNKLTKNMNEDERRILAYTMLFHDIGKPDTHVVREKNGVKIDSFFNHNKQSVKIANTLLSDLNFNEKEKNIILSLIYKHDIFMFITIDKTTNPYHKQLTKEVIDEEINDLNKVGDGHQLLNWLLLVGRADNYAQNEKMTQKSLLLLDKFYSMLNNQR